MDNRTAISSGMWLKFFTNAGIPESVSASYANKFAENRIKRDMIKDLTKDILRDMGVACMGDIIAILRHAKEVYDEEILEKVIGQSNSSVQTATVRPTKVSSGRKGSPASRVQEHHVRRSTFSADGSPVHTTDVRGGLTSPDQVKSTSHHETKSSSSASPIEKIFRKQTKSSGADEATSCTSRKRSDSSSGGHSLRKTESSTSVKRKVVDEEAPVKKARRVLPEHEGGYKITMPSGTTARTQEILKKKALLHAAQKKSVFERLGAGSEEEASPTPIADTTFRVTGLDCGPFVSSSSSVKSLSVFSRLGDKSQPPMTSSTTGDAPVQNPLPYHGILKQSNKKIIMKRAPVVRNGNSIMRADEEGQPASRTKVTSIAPSVTTVILPAAKTEGRNLISGRGCTMRADEEVCLKVVGTSPVVKRLRTSNYQPTAAPADKPVMRQIFRNRATQGILAAPVNHQKLSVKSRLGVGSISSESSPQFVPGKKRVMFEKREVRFMGASEKPSSSSCRSRVILYQKPVKIERQGQSNFKNSVFHRLGRNCE